jgi:tryptophan synthase alpha chain
MNLEDKFLDIKKRREGALMPHVYYGDPNEAFSQQLISNLCENGADLIEFGIPFSDPTADGPTFQAACQRALRNNITPIKCIQGIEKLRKKGLNVPIILTTYFNIIYSTGTKTFLKKIKKVNAQGILIPDLPYEEACSLLNEAKQKKIHIIFQVAPTTTDNRLQHIAENASGFLYIINIEGVTGVRTSMQESTLKLVKRVRKHTKMPLLAGFGIAKRENAATIVSAGADGVVVGSAYAKLYEKNISNPAKTLPDIARFTKLLKQGCTEGYRNRPLI